jgi:general secretion pathway protein E
VEAETDIVLNSQPEAPATPRHALPFSFAKRHGVLIRELDDARGTAVYRSGASPLSLAELRRFAGVPLKMSRVSADEFDALLQDSYGHDHTDAASMVDGLDDDIDLSQVAQELQEPSDLLESDDDAPIIRFINAVLTEAIKENASDVHIEPYENRLGVRFRIDGVLREVLKTRRALAPLVVSRIKVMSKLDIAEKRLPQDGRISLRVAGRAVDVRVSTMPSGHGERVVLRLLDKQAGRLDLTSLGMDPETEAKVDELIHKPHGIILVTGPYHDG